MTDVLKIAARVAEEVGANAEVALAPEYTLKDVKDAVKVVVVPVGIERKMVSRSHRETAYRIQLGVLRKATEDELENLVAYVEGLALSFFRKSLAGATCTEVRHSPLYVPDHLKERRQFTGVVELVFKEVERG